MSQKRMVDGKIGWLLGCLIAGQAVAVDDHWVAPAPMGPYGGHFDFGVPAEHGESASSPPPEYAVYHEGDALPVIQASYAPTETDPAPQYQPEELQNIDPAWSLEQAEALPPQGVNGVAAVTSEENVWALGEIDAEKLPQMGVTPEPVAAVEPCTVPEGSKDQRYSTASTPFQEAMLDDFESAGVDMEAMGREADRLSALEERRTRNQWQRQQPPAVFYPTFMPEYALGVRRANAMDPLALIPQMSGPVQYFGFR